MGTTSLRAALAALACTVGFGAAASAATFDVDWRFNTVSNLTVAPGDIVRWTWGDTLPHNVTSQGGGSATFASGNKAGIGMQFQHTFANVGVTNYLCSIHPAQMTGSVTVQAPAVPVLPGALLWLLSGGLGAVGLVGARALRRGDR